MNPLGDSREPAHGRRPPGVRRPPRAGRADAGAAASRGVAASGARALLRTLVGLHPREISVEDRILGFHDCRVGQIDRIRGRTPPRRLLLLSRRASSSAFLLPSFSRAVATCSSHDFCTPAHHVSVFASLSSTDRRRLSASAFAVARADETSCSRSALALSELPPHASRLPSREPRASPTGLIEPLQPPRVCNWSSIAGSLADSGVTGRHPFWMISPRLAPAAPLERGDSERRQRAARHGSPITSIG